MSSKRFKKLPKNTNTLKAEPINNLLSKVKGNCTTKFDESLDINILINNKQKKNEINLRSMVNLPSGTGKKVKVAVVCEEGFASPGNASCSLGEWTVSSCTPVASSPGGASPVSGVSLAAHLDAVRLEDFDQPVDLHQLLHGGLELALRVPPPPRRRRARAPSPAAPCRRQSSAQRRIGRSSWPPQ